jgi:hypothetical protein
MKDYIHYEDIPPAERKQLSKDEFRKNTPTRLWSALAAGMSVGFGIVVGCNAFPDRSDWPGMMIFGIVFCGGLGALFYEAVVQPRIIRLVERRKNS